MNADPLWAESLCHFLTLMIKRFATHQERAPLVLDEEAMINPMALATSCWTEIETHPEFELRKLELLVPLYDESVECAFYISSACEPHHS